MGAQINQGRDTGPTRPTSEIVADFQETITNRQNKLNNPGKIANLIGDFIPQQRSIQDMLASGQVDTRLTGGIPLGIPTFNGLNKDLYWLSFSIGGGAISQDLRYNLN